MKNKIFLLGLITALPIILSWVVYHFHDQIPLKTTNHGEFVSPPIPMVEFSQDKTWKIVYAPLNCCDETCDKTMFVLHQLRIALGKDADRVSLVLSVDQACDIKNLHDFKKQIRTHEPYKNKIYLVDPRGYLFMFYPGDTDPMNILKDLKHVLEVSQIG